MDLKSKTGLTVPSQLRIDDEPEPEPERDDAQARRQQAEQGGRDGIRRSAERNEREDPDWRQRFYAGIVELACASATVFTDDVWELTGLELPENSDARGVGSLFQKAAKAEIIRKRQDGRKSVRSHMSLKPLWDSLVFELPDDDKQRLLAEARDGA